MNKARDVVSAGARTTFAARIAEVQASLTHRTDTVQAIAVQTSFTAGVQVQLDTS